MKRFICLVIAAALLLASLALLYTNLLYRLFDKEQVDSFMNKVDQLATEAQTEESSADAGVVEGVVADAATDEAAQPEAQPGEAPEADENAQDEAQGIERLGFDYFPLYTRTEKLSRDYVFKINEGDINGFGSIITDATNAYGEQGITTEIYTFIIIALLSIPVYMLVRLISYNEVYAMTNEANALIRPFARGLACIACATVSVTLTWFVYRSTLYQFALSKLTNWINSFDSSKVALNAVNIVIIVVIAIALIAILKKTVFRGSVVTSVLTALLRTVLFVIFFAFLNAFLAGKHLTWYVAIFVLAALLVIGLIDLLIEPAKSKRK